MFAKSLIPIIVHTMYYCWSILDATKRKMVWYIWNVTEHKNNVLVKNNLEIFTICRNHNTVIISSSVNFLTDTNGESFWIGLNDIDIENDWVWESDKSQLLFSDWHDGEPNHYHNSDCCEIAWYNLLFRWNDRPCDFLVRYICEK
jgi:hypothetical protein